MSKTQQIIDVARKIAKKTRGFNIPKRQGEGNIATNRFMAKLRERVEHRLGFNYSEKRFSDDIDSKVDFYIPEEKTIIEIALSLRNPSSEFHKDILKALLAKDNGWEVNRLVFVAKPDAEKNHDRPLSQKIKEWLEEHHSITVEIEELPRQ